MCKRLKIFSFGRVFRRRSGCGSVVEGLRDFAHVGVAKTVATAS
jgi:hypothetical protein